MPVFAPLYHKIYEMQILRNIKIGQTTETECHHTLGQLLR
jgi:hypothetical protein